MAEPILEVKHLHVGYRTPEDTVNAVRDVSFSIAAGELLGLVGESGSGKTTVAMTMMGYLGPNGRVSGEVVYRGRDVLRMNQSDLRDLRGGRIAMVYQDPMSSLNPAIPVGEQIAEVLWTHRRATRRQARNTAVQMMERMHIPDSEANARRYVHQLSGGMQQRVVIAMAMACDPDLLILDEPTTALDVTTEATILDLIAELKANVHAAILFITHDLGVIARISDRVAVMYAGELVELGSAAVLFERPRHPYTLALMNSIPSLGRTRSAADLRPIPGRLPDLRRVPDACIFAPRCPMAREHCRRERPALFTVGDRRFARCFFADDVPLPDTLARPTLGSSTRASGDSVVLAAGNVVVSFAQRSLLETILRRPPVVVRAVDGVSLELRRNESLGLVGESGSGKTTLGKALAGIQPLTAGEVRVAGRRWQDLSGAELRETRRRVQFIFQNPEASLNPRKTVRQILRRPLVLYERVSPGSVAERIAQLLEMVQLRAEYAQRYPHELSGGEKQRVAIARAFAADPDLVIADEPLSALDVSIQASILRLLDELKERFGAGYLFMSHDLNVVRAVCDRVLVMYLGNVYESGRVEQVYSPPHHPYTEALLSAVPIADPSVRQPRIRLEGAIPSPRNPPSGCKFHPRCPRLWGEICRREMPPAQIAGGDHLIYCHRPLETLVATDVRVAESGGL